MVCDSAKLNGNSNENINLSKMKKGQSVRFLNLTICHGNGERNYMQMKLYFEYEEKEFRVVYLNVKR